MSRQKYAVVCALLLWVGLSSPAVVAAQENFEIQVYGSETAAPGSTMVELHSNIAAKGTTHTEQGVVPTEHALHETI